MRRDLSGDAQLPDVKNPRAAADRIRVATQSLTDPHDMQVVWHYLQELEDLAREQEAAVVGEKATNAALDGNVQLPAVDEPGSGVGRTVVPLRGSSVQATCEQHQYQWSKLAAGYPAGWD